LCLIESLNGDDGHKTVHRGNGSASAFEARKPLRGPDPMRLLQSAASPMLLTPSDRVSDDAKFIFGFG
jgi:hypothetical protein